MNEQNAQLKDFNGWVKVALIYGIMCRYFFEFATVIGSWIFLPWWAAAIILVAYLTWQFTTLVVVKYVKITAEMIAKGETENEETQAPDGEI